MALDGIAKVLLSSGDNETVIAQLAALPLDENLSIDLATAYGQTGQLDDAARVLKDSLKTHPDSGPLLRRLYPFTASSCASLKQRRLPSNWRAVIPTISKRNVFICR